MVFRTLKLFFLVSIFIFISNISVVADYCGPDPNNPTVRKDLGLCTQFYDRGIPNCTQSYYPLTITCNVGSCSAPYQEMICQPTGLCEYVSKTAYCWVGGGTPTPTPTPPAGCGTCNEFASPNNCSNVCPGTTCGRCSNGGADCAWGNKNCGGPGPTPTPTPPACTIPDSPTLLLPLNNADISGTTAALSWFENNWRNCPGAKRFWVFVGQCGNLPLLPNTTTQDTSYNFTGTTGQSYCWTVQALKGIYGSFKSWPRMFKLTAVAPASSWWQVDGGGVAALGGAITSLLPAGQFLDASTTTPGIVVSTGTINVGSGDINNTPNKWKVENSPAFSPAFWTSNGYPAIQKRILQSVTPKSVSRTIGLSDITSADLSNGAYYVKSTENLSINPLIVGTKKVVIITDEGKDVNINGNITLDNGGFLMILAGGNITVNSNVTKLQGLFVANGTFDTGSSSTTPLEVDGTVATLGGVNFRRDIPGNTPAQSFVFRPDLVAAMPKDALRRHIRWEEVAPLTN